VDLMNNQALAFHYRNGLFDVFLPPRCQGESSPVGPPASAILMPAHFIDPEAKIVGG
jgi:hypothetical protein